MITDRLSETYDLTGVMIHRPKHGTFGGLTYGELVTYSSKLQATGFEIAESIAIAQQHVVKVQEAIHNMERILNEAKPIAPENRTAV